ncbi:hypothetical protein COP1_024124 [Malus domestica]
MNATTAVLIDSGNLQLIFEQDILWQSFDHPSDTLLPSMKLSLNKITGQQACLTSWAALDDSQRGLFSVGIDPKLPRQLINWKGNATYWRNSSVKIRAVLSPTGQFNLLLWNDKSRRWLEVWREPLNKRDFYAECGPYSTCDNNGDTLSSQCKCSKGFRTELHKQWAMGDWPGGCVREKALRCDKGEGFEKFEEMKCWGKT